MNKKIFSFFLFIIVLTAIGDVFVGVNDPNRIIVVIIQFIGVLLGFVAFLSFIRQKSSSLLQFNKWLVAFLIFMTLYAIFSNQFISYYPRVLYSILPFYIFFNAAKSGVEMDKKLQYFVVVFTIVSVYQLYIGFFERQEIYGELMNRADNIAYQLLSVMVVLAILQPKLMNLILTGVVYFAILFSLKRGAMISASVLLVFYYFGNTKNIQFRRKNLEILGGLSFLIVTPYLIIKYAEVLFYRFKVDQTGSDRLDIYANIIDDWLKFPLINKIFGQGFFTLGDGTTYAHSDWLELLNDHGIVGIIIFIGVFVSLFMTRKKIERFAPKYNFAFLGVYFVLFLKSVYSGTYMTKYDALTYGILGLVLGTVYYNKIRVVKFHNESNKP